MQRDLTKRYAVTHKKQWKTPFSFLHDLYRYGKLREAFSFMVWESMHRLRLFPRSSYVKFASPAVIPLSGESIGAPELDAKVAGLFASLGMSAVRSGQPWKLLFLTNDREMIGCLSPNDTDLYKSSDHGQTLTLLHRFPESIKSIFVSSHGTIFVCAKGAVYRGTQDGAPFQKSFDLGASESFLRFNNAMTETPDHLLMFGEYGNVWDESGWRKLAFLYHSSDDGQTWQTSSFMIERGANKHIHIVKYSRLLDRIVVADGDNYKRLWLSAPLDSFDVKHPIWELVNRSHIQMGGHTAAVEAGGKIFFGTDYQGGTNFILETTDGKNYRKQVIPDPYRRSPIDNMVVRKSARGEELWANLPFSTGSSRCLLMVSADQGRTWNKVFEYSRSAHTVWLISTSREVTEEVYVLVADNKTNTRSVYRITDAQ